jgi:hypothetical protein
MNGRFGRFYFSPDAALRIFSTPRREDAEKNLDDEEGCGQEQN